MGWSSIGVPDVPNLPKNIGDAVIKFGGAQTIKLFFGNYWGIFDQNGLPLLLVDNVKSVKFQNATKISNAPVEKGSFASYNKVIEPYTVNVVVTKSSGGATERGAFLALLDGFANSTDLFMVITPEAIYPNCNIVGYDYLREASNGARMIKASIQLQEVRLVTAQYTKTKVPAAEPAQNAGTVSGKEAGNAASTDKSILKQGMEIFNKDGLSGLYKEGGKILKEMISGGGNVS